MVIAKSLLHAFTLATILRATVTGSLSHHPSEETVPWDRRQLIASQLGKGLAFPHLQATLPLEHTTGSILCHRHHVALLSGLNISPSGPGGPGLLGS